MLVQDAREEGFGGRFYIKWMECELQDSFKALSFFQGTRRACYLEKVKHFCLGRFKKLHFKIPPASPQVTQPPVCQI